VVSLEKDGAQRDWSPRGKKKKGEGNPWGKGGLEELGHREGGKRGGRELKKSTPKKKGGEEDRIPLERGSQKGSWSKRTGVGKNQERRKKRGSGAGIRVKLELTGTEKGEKKSMIGGKKGDRQRGRGGGGEVVLARC